MVGAIGGFNALADASRSGPSPGGREGGAEAAPESRLGLGGGASLRDMGGVESCTPVAVASAVWITPLAASARAAASEASRAGDSAGGDSAGSVTPTCVVSSEFSIVIQLST